MRIKVIQRPGKNVPRSMVHTSYGSPVRVLGSAPDWISDGKNFKQVKVEIWSPLLGWKEQTVFKSSLVYT